MYIYSYITLFDNADKRKKHSLSVYNRRDIKLIVFCKIISMHTKYIFIKPKELSRLVFHFNHLHYNISISWKASFHKRGKDLHNQKRRSLNEFCYDFSRNLHLYEQEM